MTILRFAPSPTGPLHLGGLRTALLNHLFARKHGGKWILRIEDTDATRFVPGSVENIQRGLEWAGLHYDFGPGIGGSHGPYFQSQRLDLYQSYAKKLLDSGDAYRCFCSADKLAATRERLLKSGSTSAYDRSCVRLTEEEVARRVRAHESHVIRLDLHKGKELPLFVDLVFGEVADARGSLPTDPIILKSDGFPTYHLASVVDDHEMGITHVMRGEEWLPSLPLHRDLYNRLGLKAPQFGHLPLLLNPDGSKMSKRKGDVRVQDYIEKNWEPEAVISWLGLAGRNLSGSGHASPTLEQLISNFNLNAYTNRRAVLDPAKLAAHNRNHMSYKLGNPDTSSPLIRRAQQVVNTAFSPKKPFTDEYIKSVLMVLGDRVSRLDDLPNIGRYFFDPSSIGVTETPSAAPSPVYTEVTSAVAELLQSLTTLDNLSDELKLVQKRLQHKPKQFMSSLRHALTGMEVGPSLVDTITVLGIKESCSRLRLAAVRH